MSKARLIITAVVLEGRSQADVARTYGVSKGWVSKLVARWRLEGDAAFQTRSRRPRSSPNATPPAVIERILNLRVNLQHQGLDHGPSTIAWHLAHHHSTRVSRATIARILHREGLVTPTPKKRPKSSYLRFEAALPNETWQADFTHVTLADGTDAEVLTWLDDCTRYAISITAHTRVTTPDVLATFRAAAAAHGTPASTLTDNGMVFTVRLAGLGRRGGRNAFETELHRLGIQQKNGSPSHPQTQGKVERFQQTMKRWLRARAAPTTIADLQTLLNRFRDDYNERRPHRSLPHQATPATRYRTLPKAAPNNSHQAETHDRVRRDRIDKTGKVTLRHASRQFNIHIGRAHAGTRILMLIQDLEITIINAATGELLRELTLDPSRQYQPLNSKKPPNPRVQGFPMS
ncbi:MAG: IS481 family transposase [Microthrixaceae bacterium]|nr:IS481 family transposase [Microthrixaceae bacterium]